MVMYFIVDISAYYLHFNDYLKLTAQAGLHQLNNLCNCSTVCKRPLKTFNSMIHTETKPTLFVQTSTQKQHQTF